MGLPLETLPVRLGRFAYASITPNSNLKLQTIMNASPGHLEDCFAQMAQQREHDFTSSLWNFGAQATLVFAWLVVLQIPHQSTKGVKSQCFVRKVAAALSSNCDVPVQKHSTMAGLPLES